MQKTIGFLILAITIISCARISMPEGGKKDVTPPTFLSSIPKALAVNVEPEIKEIILNFDEYVLVKEASKQVLISPSPQITPVIQPTSTARKNISIKFYEPLIDNTTYTINFGSSIQDNNEGNKLENFTYIFSTGSEIDSLHIEGKLKQSLESKYLPSALVSLYKIQGDTIDLKSKPYYVTRTDSTGHFTLNHLSEGKFRLIAFNDLNSNLIINIDKEEAGFFTGIVDTKEAKEYDIVLAPVKQPYKAKSIAQEGQGTIKFNFKGNPEEVSIQSLNEKFPKFNIHHPKYTDSLYLYFDTHELKDFGKKERVKFLVEYKEHKDTLSTFYDNEKKSELALSLVNKEITPTDFLTLRSSNFIEKIESSKIEVYKGKEPVEFTVETDSLEINNINIKFPITYNSDYKVSIYPEAVTDFLGQGNKDSLVYDIKIKKESEYGNLTVQLQNMPDSHFFFQLLNEKKETVKNIYGKKDSFEFKNLKPGKYFLRILVDENNNGFWDLADLEKFVPAEKTYLFSKPIEVRAFWNLNETWILQN